MIRVFKTIDGKVHQINDYDLTQKFEKDSWIALTNPKLHELEMIAANHHIDIDDLKSALDVEERSRIEVEDEYTLIVLDIPKTEMRNEKEYFCTIPFAIIKTDDVIITVCLEDTAVLTVFMDGRYRGFDTSKPAKFIYQMLYRNATMYLQYLRIIDKKTDEIENKLRNYQRNQELMDMLELQKSLVYITTSLRGNELVLEKLTRNTSIKRTEEEYEILEDAIIENKQGMEMAKIFDNILSGTMNAYSSIISNNLNMVMKFLSVITIVLTIPTIVTSAYGMNFKVIPLSNNPYGFLIIIGLCIVLAVIAGILIEEYQKFK